MPVYVIAQLRFTDMTAYSRYLARFPAVLSRFKGRVLAADTKATVLEGAWDREKIVVIEFEDEAESQRFEDDEEYRAIVKDRRAGADAVIVRARGLRPKAEKTT